jgi:hypothetical protein
MSWYLIFNLEFFHILILEGLDGHMRDTVAADLLLVMTQCIAAAAMA